MALVGLTQYVPVARQLLELFPEGIEEDKDRRFEQIDDDDVLERIEELTDLFFEVGSESAVEEFREKMAAYIFANPAEFLPASRDWSRGATKNGTPARRYPYLCSSRSLLP